MSVQLLQQAVQAQQRGQPAEAERLCLLIVASEPRNANAHHLLGVARAQQGRNDEALTSLQTALKLNSNSPEVLMARGSVLKAMERFEEALENYDRALRLKPDLVEAQNNRAVVLWGLKRIDEALDACDRALAIRADYAKAPYNKGNMLAEQKRFEEAVTAFDRAIAIRPGYAEALNNRGNALRMLGRHAEAVAAFDRVIALQPGFADAHSNKGIALRALKRPAEALASFDRAIALRADFAEAHNNRGNALQELERPEEALASFERFITLSPDSAGAYSNRANMLKELKRLDEARAGYDRAIALDGDFAEAYWNKSLGALLTGDYETGWPLYEWRKKYLVASQFGEYASPLWLGTQDIAGKTLLIHAEQGLGDTVNFCRYALLAAARGARVILAVQDVLVRLIGSLGHGVDVIGLKAPQPAHDFHVPLLSLPLAFATRAQSIPAPTAYLSAEGTLVEKWKARIGDAGFKVGINWQGNKQAGIDLGRSLALRHFAPLAGVPGVRLISLQKNAGVEQLADLPPGMRIETLDDDFDSGPDAFVDTAAAMMNLDLIVSSDTALPHLAGALGRRTWLALKHVPDWRWLLDRADSPWYPSMRLFRQSARGDWAGVFTAMAQELAAERTGRN